MLVIKKNSGPYQFRFDLPGGSQELGESMLETLHREIIEETGYHVRSEKNNRIYSAWVYEDERMVVTHHIFNLYDIDLSDDQADLPEFVTDGKNDSDEALWISLQELTENNSSPLIHKVIAEIKTYPDVDKVRIYKNWEVLTAYPTVVENN
ncbi:hypothetical protein RT41_GL001367 [Lactococcus fujiensis JCM 16395]|uniref:Nudix hydrolase domain-containing protein n=1 Tax=Lactococcus fujiensis JCM 16395 TaxID=1291764 RepID=A0A2A5RMI7_9LACT|nr:hypothetical protein RT41_GL001367 [Lactococcus fujiensis JCM 16395]